MCRVKAELYIGDGEKPGERVIMMKTGVGVYEMC